MEQEQQSNTVKSELKVKDEEYSARAKFGKVTLDNTRNIEAWNLKLGCNLEFVIRSLRK